MGNSRVKIFLTSFLLSVPFWWGANFSQNILENTLYAQISQPLTDVPFVNIPKTLQKPKLELDVKSALATKFKIGKEEGLIFFEKNRKTILPIASLTKLMTGLVILENPQDYDFSRAVTVSRAAASQDDVPNYGNLKAGESFTVKKLLDLMLVYSSNDAAFALAEETGLDNFIEKMNLKARDLGLADTHFANPTGLDPENLHFEPESQNDFNYSTAEDLTALARYILKNYSLIFEISSNGGPYPTLNGLSKIAMPPDFMILGGKTGNTDEAKGCLLLIAATRQGDIFINIILGASSPEKRVEEMQKLVDWLAS
ncbi:MAG: D-alanyl-D-alanine carboxypeptidase [Candidatus Nealsonbacteria bacterium]|nr:D-alanyl-D-alanine carboxypeptidase [Candidatus Nealsonbacteria bacterium]